MKSTSNLIPPADDRQWHQCSIILLFAAIGWVLITFDDNGISWDEYFHIQWGEAKWDFLTGLLSGNKSLSDASELTGSSVHPGFFDVLNAGLRRILPFDPFSTGHLLSGLFGVAGLAAVWRIGRLLGSERTGFLAILFLLLTPRFVGHMAFNPKDIPFAVAYAWALFFLLKTVRAFPRLEHGSIIGLGVATGAALGVRIAGFLMPCYLVVGLAWHFFRVFTEKPQTFAEQIRQPKTFLPVAALPATLIISIATVLPFWPALWIDTNERGGSGAAETFARAQNFDWNAPVLFNGSHTLSSELPRTYLPHWIAVTTPEWLLMGLAAATFFATAEVRRKKAALLHSTEAFSWALTGFAALFPIAYVMVTHPTLYDGLRHFLFVLPPLAIVAAWGLDRLVSKLPVRPAFAVAALAGVLGLNTVWNVATLYPYHYCYFNNLVGGLPGAFGKWETDYWGLSFRESVGLLNQRLMNAFPESLPAEPVVSVSQSAASWMAEPFFPNEWRFASIVDEPEDIQFVLTYTRMQDHLRTMQMHPGARMIDAVTRQKTPLNIIVQLRPYPPRAVPAESVQGPQPQPSISDPSAENRE